MTRPLELLYEDDHLAVVSKPARMLSVPTPGVEGVALPDVLVRQGLTVFPVHRLDREVSGAVLFAKDENTRALLDTLFRERQIHKTYWALVQGHVRPRDGTFHFPILEEGSWARVSARGKKSTTRYRTLQELPNATIVEIELVTGRYNQIRVHFAHAGFPLVGERKYARGKDSPLKGPSRRVALHAWRLAFAHPLTGAAIAIESAVPSDLVELVDRASTENQRATRAPRDARKRTPRDR